VSGIAGIVHRDGRPVSPDAIARMSAAIAHRGGDASGSICEGTVALAHRMSWSTPESKREIQPLIRAAPASWLVADARIDNRGELTSLLRVAEPGNITDAELIARAYERWGRRCVEHLVGDFAFALWDGEARELYCARDPMGVKPLYYFESADSFAFASEAKALFALDVVPREIDPLQVARFVEGTIGDRERTHFKGIMRLPAAHWLAVGRDRSLRTQYWRPDPQRELRYSSSGEYAEAFHDIFTEAVRSRMRSIHGVGAALSGGLDSSSIVCTARDLRREAGGAPIHSFSLVFPSLPERDLRMIDEREYIDSVVRGGGVLPTYVRGDELSPAADVSEILRTLDEPYPAFNLYLHWAMYRAARERGARVFLDGFDGDTAVSHGFGRFSGLVHRREWDVFERETRALAERRQVRPEALLSHFGLPHLAVLARRGSWLEWARAARELTRRFDLAVTDVSLNHGLRPATPAIVRSAYRAMRRSAPELHSLLLPELARALREGDAGGASEDDASVLGTERESHVQGLSQPAYQLTLEMADQCAAAFGVEPRYPFFDRRLIDFCVALPDSEKLAEGWPRLVFRRAMQGVLPPEIQWRSGKGNLSPNFHRTLRAAQASAGAHSADSPLAAYVDVSAVEEMRRRYCAESTTLARSDDGHALFRIMVLERWLSEGGGQTSSARRRSSPVASAAA
jgi:asparagine synthase (glutamine-hydrolysing)